jgi:hypothetical protein
MKDKRNFPRLIIGLIAVLVLSVVALNWQTWAQSTGQSAIYAQIFKTQTSTGRSLIFVDARGVGATNHVFTWTTAGVPGGCTLLIESSLDAVTWTTASTQTCTSSGSVTLPDASYSFLTANLSVLTGGSTPSIDVAYRGYLPGQGVPVRPAEGGTGSTTAFTAGSVLFSGASGVYGQDNANLFWDNSNKRLCLLANSCSNTLDIGGAKFFVTSLGAMTSYEAVARARVAGNVAATVQAAAGQTANLHEWKNSGGSVLASVTSAGVITPTSGIAATGKSRFSTVPIGFTAYGSFGTNTTLVAGTTYWAEVFIPRNVTLTGIGVLNGATVGTNKWVVGLYGSAGGSVLANSALAGATSSGADAFQELAFTGTYAAVGPARYWIAFQSDGTTDKARTIAASTFVDVLTKSATGSFGTLPSLTVPTTFTADVGPAAYVY